MVRSLTDAGYRKLSRETRDAHGWSNEIYFSADGRQAKITLQPSLVGGDFALNEKQVIDIHRAVEKGSLDGAKVCLTKGSPKGIQIFCEIDIKDMVERLHGVTPRQGRYGPFHWINAKGFPVGAQARSTTRRSPTKNPECDPAGRGNRWKRNWTRANPPSAHRGRPRPPCPAASSRRATFRRRASTTTPIICAACGPPGNSRSPSIFLQEDWLGLKMRSTDGLQNACRRESNDLFYDSVRLELCK